MAMFWAQKLSANERKIDHDGWYRAGSHIDANVRHIMVYICGIRVLKVAQSFIRKEINVASLKLSVH